MPEHLPVMRRITEAFRQVADNMRRAREMEDTTRQVEAVFHGPGERWTYAPHVANPAAPTVAELEAGTEIHGLSFWHEPPEVGSTVGRMGGRIGPPADILDRIDDTLLTYDSQHADGTEPWPYRGF